MDFFGVSPFVIFLGVIAVLWIILGIRKLSGRRGRAGDRRRNDTDPGTVDSSNHRSHWAADDQRDDRDDNGDSDSDSGDSDGGVGDSGGSSGGDSGGSSDGGGDGGGGGGGD